MDVVSFNPHPAFLPGDASRADELTELADVSIRTRHFCRVMHYPITQILTVAEFQSAPGISAG